MLPPNLVVLLGAVVGACRSRRTGLRRAAAAAAEREQEEEQAQQRARDTTQITWRMLR